MNLRKENNRDYEFYADLSNHPLGNQNVYRLHYINYHRIGEGYGMGPNNVGVVDYAFKPFILPRGMSREDAFKVLSYLTDYLEHSFSLEACSESSVEFLDKTLDLERLGFTKLNINADRNDNDIIDLFTVSGRVLLFKQSEYYSRYFEWYHEDITFEEVKDIYARCGIDFYDIEVKTKDEVKSLKKANCENN